jgi:ComF family protein
MDQEDPRYSRLQTWRHQALGAGRLLLDHLYPPVCLVCDAPTGEPDTLCLGCFRRLRAITMPYCPVLGLPFAASLGDDAVSAEAIADPPPFRRARSAVVYDDISRAIVSRLKYGDRPEYARFCARLMVQAGHDYWSASPVLVPVPLHPWRQLGRRYNQSTELARAIARLTGSQCRPQLVARKRWTRQQVGLSLDGRARNVQGAFSVHPDALAVLAGRPVVLVDDVYTTGATLKAATRALKRAGIDHIDVLSFARVVSGDQLPI